MNVKFKESTQLYNFCYVATAIATVVYSDYECRPVSTNMNDTL